VTETRRHALKILGAMGASCAFPFTGDELYGQHHASAASPATPTAAQRSGQATPYAPTFFTSDEYVTMARVADLIIPPTETPGAVDAGVPEYIDRVVSLNAVHQPIAREGLAWLDREADRQHARAFVDLPEADAVALLQPLSDEVDREDTAARQSRFRADTTGRLVYHMPVTDRTPPTRATDAGAATRTDAQRIAVRCFRLMKNLTADGYYTSRAGLLDELRYPGNTATSEFPPCVR
jgi:hypothetical protein